MKLPLLEEVQRALNTRKKNGELVFDQDNLEVGVAGTFVGDKFIVIRQKGEAPPKLGELRDPVQD